MEWENRYARSGSYAQVPTSEQHGVDQPYSYSYEQQYPHPPNPPGGTHHPHPQQPGQQQFAQGSTQELYGSVPSNRSSEYSYNPQHPFTASHTTYGGQPQSEQYLKRPPPSSHLSGDTWNSSYQGAGKYPKPQRPSHYYIPPILRLPALLIIFVITVGLIGVVEYGVQKLPHAKKTQYTSPQEIISSILHKRQVRVTTSQSTVHSTTPQSTFTATAGGAYIPTAISTAPQTPQIPQTTRPPILSTTATVIGGGGYIPTAISTVPQNTPTTPITVPTGTVGTGTQQGGGYIPTAISTSTTAFAPSSGGGYIPTTIVLTSSGNGGAYIVTSIGTVIATSSGAGYIPTTIVTSIAGKPTTFVGSIQSSGDLVTIIKQTTSSFTTSGVFTTSSTETLTLTGADGKLTTSTTVVPTTSTGVAVVTTEVPLLTPQEAKFQYGNLVIANYLPLVVSVCIVQFWTAIYSQAKLIEPFVRLNTDTGVAANSVMDAFYLSSYLTPDPILAIVRKHWLVLWTSLVYFAMGALSPVGSEFLFFDTSPRDDCPVILLSGLNNQHPCWPPRLSIDPMLARIVEGLLTFAAVMTLSLAVMMLRTRTGIYSDPSTIASITSLVHHPEVVNDFRSFSTEATMKEVRHFLMGKFYKLSDYQRPDGVWRYGFVPTVPTMAHQWDEKPLKAKKPRYRTWKVFALLGDILFMLCLLALLGIVAAYYKDDKDDPFNRFYNSGAFGPAFSLTATAALMSINWKRLERECHTLSAYHRMSQAPTEAKKSILLRKSSIPITAIIPMFFRGHFFASWMSFVTVLSEILIIFLGSVPLSFNRIRLELLIAYYANLAILGIEVLTVIALMIWKRRLPDLPRAPDTIAAVVSYVADSRMLDDFEGFEYCDDNEMTARLAGTGKRYVYGKRLGSDGQERYLVDEDTQLNYS